MAKDSVEFIVAGKEELLMAEDPVSDSDMIVVGTISIELNAMTTISLRVVLDTFRTWGIRHLEKLF